MNVMTEHKSLKIINEIVKDTTELSIYNII